MTADDEERLTSRRAVLATGARLAYAAPLIAASFALTDDGALAATCPAGYQPVQVTTGPTCCRCRQSVLVRRTLVVIGGTAQCTAPRLPTMAAECKGTIQSL